MLAIKANEIYMAGAVPKALRQNVPMEIPETAKSLVALPVEKSKKNKALNVAEAANAATTPPREMVFDLVNLAASGQTITIPNAVGTAPIVLINDDNETCPVND